MHRWTGTAALVAGAVIPVSGAAQPNRQADDDAGRAAAAIRPNWISAHVRALADDLMEGRETATRGGLLAARYVAAQFESVGLEPAPGAASFIQRMPLRHARVVEGTPRWRS